LRKSEAEKVPLFFYRRKGFAFFICENAEKSRTPRNPSMFVKKSKGNVYAFPRRSQFLGVLGDKKKRNLLGFAFSQTTRKD
jgi:hypothetical protein